MKIQRIRACQQCGDLLALKCDRCKKHPNRVGRVIEVFDLPPILETNACGCVKIACEIPDDWRPATCKRSAWRTLYQAKHAKSRYCSLECNLIVRQKTKNRSVMVKCKMCPKMVKRFFCEIKQMKHAFCSQLCRKLNYLKEREAANEGKNDFESRQLLACYSPKHRGEITEHWRVARNKYKCVDCSAARNVGANLTVMGSVALRRFSS